MYKIWNMKTDKWLIGTSGKIRWTSEENARIFKRKEDVRNFLRFCVGLDYGFVLNEHIDKIPSEWTVVRFVTVNIGTKSAPWVLREGIK